MRRLPRGAGQRLPRAAPALLVDVGAKREFSGAARELCLQDFSKKVGYGQPEGRFINGVSAVARRVSEEFKTARCEMSGELSTGGRLIDQGRIGSDG
jgi:hypothetical protein